MQPVHSRVIARNGLVSVWLENVAASVYASLPRISGFVQGLVTIDDAEAEAQRRVQAVKAALPYGVPDAMTDD